MRRAALSIPDPDPRERALARTLGTPDLVARVLLARGIDDPSAARALLKPDLRSLGDPFAFTQMETAVDRVRRALRDRERILILGDYDVDGISSTVLLLKFFAMVQADASPFIPARSDGYSFCEATLAAVREHRAGLAISVDNGTNAVEYARRIQDSGCDLIITDHHGTTDHVAEATAVLNPRLPGAGYPDRNLAGVGVAFCLATALAESFSTSHKLSPEFRTFLLEAMAYVALGTIADVAPLCGENRILVHHGLRALAESPNPGIRALLDSARVRGQATTEDVAFRIAPLINAAGRVGHALEAVELFMAPGMGEAQAKAKALEQHNTARRQVERDLMEVVTPLAAASDDPVIVLGGADWHPGVLGIAAARLVDQFERPVFLVSFDGDNGRGSARSPQGYHLRNAMAECADLLPSYGGHAAAAGMAIARENLDAFRVAINRAFHRHRPEALPLKVDGTASFGELEPRHLRALEQLGPFGQGNPRPRFAAPKVTMVGGPTVHSRGYDLRVRLAGDGVVLPARIPGGARHFEEVRSLAGPLMLAFSPRLSHRGEEGPVHLDVHSLAPAAS